MTEADHATARSTHSTAASRADASSSHSASEAAPPVTSAPSNPTQSSLKPAESPRDSVRAARDADGHADAGRVEASLRWCAQVAREQARNFYYGMKLTPEPRRSALYAVYAFMRQCDDLADEPAPGLTGDAELAARRERIETFRSRMQQVINGGDLPARLPDQPADRDIWPAFRHVFETHRLSPALLHAMLDGQAADLQPIEYRSFEDLYGYCYNVASVVGLVCIDVWGYTGGYDTQRLAEARGIAFQLTNILRDLREDAQRGRCYLPTDELEAFGMSLAEATAIFSGQQQPDERFDRFMAFQINRARAYFERSDALDRRINPSCRSTSWALMRIYRGLLERIAEDPRQVLAKRVSLSKLEKVAIALKASRLGSRAGCADEKPQPLATPLEAGKHQARSAASGDGFTGVSIHQPRHTVIVGGGLAGMAAAIRLAEHGQRVTLVETRMRLGGRATSFVDPKNSMVLDNCQHVVMGCCTSLLDFYDRLGVGDRIEWHRQFHFAWQGDSADFAPTEAQRVAAAELGVDGHVDILGGEDLPAPLHFSPSFNQMSMLSLAEKIAIAHASLAMAKLGTDGRDAWSDRSFADFLRSVGQTQGTIDKYWAPVIISACNAEPEHTSARYAMQVFQEGFMAHPRAYEMGLSSVPLVRLYDAAEQAIRAAGGQVMLRSGAEAFEFEEGQVTALRLSDGTRLEGDAFISAVPPDRLAKMADEAMVLRDERLRQLDAIRFSPILGVHLWYEGVRADRPVMPLPHLSLVHSPVQWLFNKGMTNKGQHIHAVISAADNWVDLPTDEVIARADREVRRFLPRARAGRLLQSRSVKEKRATFLVSPGVDALRPTAAGPIANLFLAGDWVDTGWPATMEGAVRSGYNAAAGVLDLCRTPAPLRVPDLTPGRLYQAI